MVQISEKLPYFLQPLIMHAHKCFSDIRRADILAPTYITFLISGPFTVY